MQSGYAIMNIMVNFIRSIRENENKRVLFLHGFFASYLLLMALGMALNHFILDDIEDFYVNFASFALAALLYLHYLYFRNFDIAKGGLLLLASLSTDALLISSYYHAYYFHILVPMTYFLLYSLRTSLLITLIHSLTVVAVYVYGYYHTPYPDTFPAARTFWGIGLASLTVILFGIVYHFAVEAPYRKLEKLYRQNDALLKEVHHRVKNNLYIISSLIGMQQNRQRDNPEVYEILQKNRLRIFSIAAVHDLLYKHNDFEKIELRNYLQKLSEMTINLYDNKNITIQLHISEPFLLPFEYALKLGIITNELLINSIKHAFDEEGGEIIIHFERTEEHDLFRYCDNGDTPVDIERLIHSKNLGYHLITMMVKDLDATLDVVYNDGLSYTILIPRNALLLPQAASQM